MNLPKTVPKKTIFALCLIALVATMSTVLAAGYLIVSPASDQLTVNPKVTPPDEPDPEPATLSKVKLNVNTIEEGDTVTLATLLSDKTSGVKVVFYDQDDKKVGEAATNVDGRACITITPAAGTYTYYATCMHPGTA